MEYTLGYCLKRSSWKFANKTAIVFQDRRITYYELNRRVNLLANALIELGVQKGDKVASILFNTPELIEIYFAAAKIGAISVPINFRLVGREASFIVKQSDSKILIYDGDLRRIIDEIDEKNSIKMVSMGKTRFSDSIDYEELLSQASDEEPEVPVSETDLRFIMYTSGTTGIPKGAMFTHRNNLWGALTIVVAKKYDPNDVVLLVNPLFHMNSYINVIACVFMGNTIVVMRNFDPLKMLELMEKEKVTICSIVPTICKRLIETIKDKHFDTQSWRYCTCTGAAWPFGMKKDFMKSFPHVVMADAYGATELFCGTLIEGHEMLKKPTSVGRPYTDTIIRIVDQNGEELPPNQTGEILFYGPTVTQGYYKNPEATAQALRDGWFFSGDIGYFDEDGYLYFLDRRKDMIVSGGENIYSAEIENVLIQNPKIKEAAVLGVPDEEWGKVVKAYVVLHENEKMDDDEVIQFCLDNLASYKKPRYVEFMKSLPKNALGKVLKRELEKD